MIAGIVLAGGEGRRIGGDKPFVALAGRPLLAHVVERIRPQVDRLALAVRQSDARFEAFGLPQFADPADMAGPLAGLVSGLAFAAASGADWLLTVPTDAPLLPADLVGRLRAAALPETEAVVARSAGASHPTVALYRPALGGRLAAHLDATPRRSIIGFLERLVLGHADFAAFPVDPFLNLNTPDDLAAARSVLSS